MSAGVAFAGRIAVVTGAASGIGEAVARHLAERGARIVGVDLNPAIIELPSRLPGAGHHGIVADLTDPSAAEAAIREAVATTGTPDILVNSAGLALLDPALEVTPERWRTTLEVNLGGTFSMSQAAGRVMIEAGYGRIVNLASQAAVIGLEGHAAYSASKAGVLGLTRVLALEWARLGVTVNAVSPTIVDTPLGRAAWAGERGDRAREAIPSGRFARPEEVAALVAFLAGEDAAMITGANYAIDGGVTAV